MQNTSKPIQALVTRGVLALLLVGVALGAVAAEVQPKASRPQAVAAYGKVPLSFEANRGQTDAEVRFLSRGNVYTLFLTPKEVVLSLKKPKAQAKALEAGLARLRPDRTTRAELRMKLVGANPVPEIVGLNKLPGRSNYFIGNDPEKWHTDVPSYARVEFQEVYPGINLVFYGNQRQLEFDFVVAPGADRETIALSLQGADSLEIDRKGNLVSHIAGEEIRFKKPLVYQEIDGVKNEISASYVLNPKSKLVGFQVAAYDASRPLVIDPVLEYSTFLGGTSVDLPTGIAVDSSGNAYVTGNTLSADFPTTTGAFQTSKAGDFDFYITKLNPAGSDLVYSTFLGGTGVDGGANADDNNIALDSSGNAYITGSTQSSDFSTTGDAFDEIGNASLNNHDAFVAKFSFAPSAVAIDIWPKKDAKKINLNSGKDINVAIFSLNGFDATTVDATTVLFGRTGVEASPAAVVLKDVNKDGLVDMLLSFNAGTMGIQCGDTQVVFTGQTNNGQPIRGSDSIKVKKCKK